MIKVNGLPVEQFNFPAGEVHIRLPKGLKAYDMSVVAKITSSDDLVALFLVKDAIERQFGDIPVKLKIPYYPYGRQDRVANHGEALSLQVVTELLSSKFTDITTYDFHNPEVLRSLNGRIHNCSLNQLWKILQRVNKFIVPKNVVLVAPDAGSKAKVKALAKQCDYRWIQGHKVRDPKTGELTGFDVSFPEGQFADYRNCHLMMVDDICDGGGTFLGLAQALSILEPKSLRLFVTHGIFSKGLKDLTEVFHTIYTTNTYRDDYPESNYLEVLKLV